VGGEPDLQRARRAAVHAQLYEDILLVRKANFDEGYLSQIFFDGYSQNYETTYHDWDKDYWQITPFNHLGTIPEPSTWGALLGTLGTGLYLLRRKRQKGRHTHACTAK